MQLHFWLLLRLLPLGRDCFLLGLGCLPSEVLNLLAPQFIIQPLEVVFLLLSGLFFFQLFLE